MSEIKIYARHSDFVVISKPAGLSVHGDQGEAVIHILQQQLNSDVYPCHRLDKNTSGLLLIALNAGSAAELSQLFFKKAVQKYYLGVVTSRPSKSQGKVIGDLQKSRNGCYKLLRTKNNPSITCFFSRGLTPGYRAMLFKPMTGRTHQLRVVAKSLAAPLLGDRRYGGAEADRMYLHAYYLAFEYQGELFQYSLPPDHGEYFDHFFQSEDDPWLFPQLLPWPV